MTQPHARTAISDRHAAPDWHAHAFADPLHPAAAPEAVLATLHALVEAHHAERSRDAGAQSDDRAHWAGRIAALYSATTSNAADLELLVRDALQAFQFGEAPGISIVGPGIVIRPATALLLTLVFHELTTNAIKFGALGGGTRHPALHIAWKHSARGVDVAWRERGVAILAPAERPRSGFGRQLIERTLASYLSTPSVFRLLPGGVDCRFTLPEQAGIY